MTNTIQQWRYWLLLPIMIVVLAACGGDGDSDEDSDTEQNNAPVQPSEPRPQRPEDLPTARVDDVMAGDMVRLENGQQVQLIGVSAPRNGAIFSEDSIQFVRDLADGEIGLERGGEETDANGNALYYLWAGDDLINYEVVRAGYANQRLEGGGSAQYQRFIEQAESMSRTENLGMWEASESSLRIKTAVFDAPGVDEENLNGEMVELVNEGLTALDLSGFTVRDSSYQQYHFPDGTELLANNTITLFSGCGVDSTTEFYWCSNAPIWNNSGDTIFVSDASGHYVDHRTIIIGR